MAVSFGQNGAIKSMVDSLQYLKVDTLDCSADLYWRIIAKGDKAIPFLIEKLTDTTQTNIKYHCKIARVNVGEVAQFALTQIAYFPAFLITKLQFDVIVIDETGEGCWSFYDFFFINSNKARYQKDIREWYKGKSQNTKRKRFQKQRKPNVKNALVLSPIIGGQNNPAYNIYLPQ
jgi:hypothetical protein